MSDHKDIHKAAYREEAYELIAELEAALLHLEENKSDEETISRVFRALHTIKGSGAMFGFDDIASFTHNIENFYELVRNGQRNVTKELINLTLEAKDYINAMLDVSDSGEFLDDSIGEMILKSLDALMPGEADSGDVAVGAEADTERTDQDEDHEDHEVTYRITFQPCEELFQRGVNPLILIDELTSMGRHFVSANVSNIPELDKLSPEACYTSWDIILTTSLGINAIHDVFVFIDEDSRITIDAIDEEWFFTEETDYKRLGEILIERGSLTRDELESVMAGQKRIGQMLVDSGVVKDVTIKSALDEQKYIQEAKSQKKAQEVASTIRVTSEKLDRLVNLVGELVTVQARLSQISLGRKDVELKGIAEEVDRLASELHDNTMSIRMVPIGTTFTRFKRLVRDLGEELGRDLQLTTFGGETELDKTVIERLTDPLIHIIRNSIDHGIEDPEIREAVGKTKVGTVSLKASHSGADVLIEVSDDGAGLDEQAILARAVEKGLIKADSELSSHELHNLIFKAGFSTAKRVTDVSGRGVGMDVVRRSIDTLRGVVEVESIKGVGTTISLRIPLTLAIIDGLLVKLGTAFYVLPLSSVDECVEITAREINAAHGRNLVNVRNEMLPYIRLRKLFKINGKRPEREQVVIAMINDLKVGFAVDNVIGEHQTVIKSLSRVYNNVKGISGATILGDGTVALILDMSRLLEEAEIEERKVVGQ